MNEEAANSAKKINFRDIQNGGSNATNKTNQQWRANQHERACVGLPSLWCKEMVDLNYSGENWYAHFWAESK